MSDSSGASIPNATVTVTDTLRGTSSTLSTSTAGAYATPPLGASTYTVKASAKGFRTAVRSGIVIGVGQTLTVNFQLQPGAVTQTVTVAASAPLLNTTTATLGGTLSNTIINNLPLNGRNFLNLLTLRPGVIIVPGGGFQTQSANGLRPQDISYVLDGMTEYEPFQGQSVSNESNFAGDASTILPIDAIQEFNVVQNPPAQYGWGAGAVANIALKSGTNQFHGTGYAFGRDTAWDARNYYNVPPAAKTPLSLQQFGGSVGGPIRKNKLFFFGAYEGQRYTIGNTIQNNIPVTVSLPSGGGLSTGCVVLTVGDCTQSIVDATNDLLAQHLSINPISAKLIGLYPNNSTSSSSVPISMPNTNTSNNGVAKVNWQPTEHQQISYSYFYGNQVGNMETTSVVSPKFRSLLTMRVQTNALHWTWDPNARWVNDFRFGYDRFQQGLPADEPADYTTPATAYGINNGVTNPVLGGLPEIDIIGMSSLGGDHVLPKLVGPDQMYELDDTVSYLHGTHYIQFGTQIQRWIVTAARFANARGRIKFNHCANGGTPLECFLVGEPYFGQILAGDPQVRVNQWSPSFFVQDSWHVKPTVTVNMGIRYDYVTPMKESHGKIANFDPSVGLIQQGVNGVGAVYNGDPNDWGPRLGIAWNPNSGNTVIRGGAGLIYQRLNLYALLGDTGLNNAFTTGLAANPTQGLIPNGTINTGIRVLHGGQLNYTNSSTPVFGNIATGITCTSSSPCSIMGINRNFKNPYVINWSLGVEHSFGQSFSVDATYTGNHGRDQTGPIDINQLKQNSPGEIACGNCENNANRPYGTKFPYLQYINMYENVYESNYNALQITATEKGSHGLSFVAGFTWSHALDDLSSNIGANPQNSYDPTAQYASSDFNIPLRFTFSATYALPQPQRFRPLLGGWNLTSIITLQSSQPWGPQDLGNDVSGTGEFSDYWNFFGNRASFSNRGPIPIVYCTSATSCTGPTGPAASAPLSTSQSASDWAQCMGHAQSLPNGPAGETGVQALNNFGCYLSVDGKSVLIPPALGTFGTMGRNSLWGTAFYNWDASIFKNFTIKERLTAQFRAEFFNVLNHPEFVNPQFNGVGDSDPSAPSLFAWSSATPDVAAQNPFLGSGGPRAMQLGLKLIF